MATTSRTEPVASWKLIDIIIVISSYFGIVLVLTAIAFAFGLMSTTQSRLTTSLAVTIIADLLIVALIIWLVRRRGGTPYELGFRPLTPSALYLPAIGFLAALGILLLYSAIVTQLGLDRFVPRNNAPEGVFDTTASTVLFATLAIFIAPFAEEVIFRGFLLGGLRKWFPIAIAVPISGVLFGLVHAELGVIIPITLIGILLAVIYIRANSLFASMGTHLIFNTVSFLATYFMERSQ